MRENRDKLRMGIPVQPPIPQDKIEQLLGHIIPEELEQALGKIKDTPRGLPSNYTITQLLKSFTGYNAWMSQAARDESSPALSIKLEETKEGDNLTKVSLLLKRGRRYMYEGRYDLATKDFDIAYEVVEKDEKLKDSFEEYPRLLEWVGMCRHLRYDLAGAAACYEKCSDLEPLNVRFCLRQ